MDPTKFSKSASVGAHGALSAVGVKALLNNHNSSSADCLESSIIITDLTTPPPPIRLVALKKVSSPPTASPAVYAPAVTAGVCEIVSPVVLTSPMWFSPGNICTSASIPGRGIRVTGRGLAKPMSAASASSSCTWFPARCVTPAGSICRTNSTGLLGIGILPSAVPGSLNFRVRIS